MTSWPRGSWQLRLVIAPGSSIARMLAITGLDKTYPTYPTLDAALSA